MTDYVKPETMVVDMIESGKSKASLPAADLLVRGALAGSYLAFVTSMALLVAAQTGQFVRSRVSARPPASPPSWPPSSSRGPSLRFF